MPASVVVEQPEVIESYYSGLAEVSVQEYGVLSVVAETSSVEVHIQHTTDADIYSPHTISEVWA